MTTSSVSGRRLSGTELPAGPDDSPFIEPAGIDEPFGSRIQLARKISPLIRESRSRLLFRFEQW